MAASSSPYFYPRPPRGGRLFPQTCCKLIDYFYPRPPRGGRPHRRLPVWLVLCHFYPRPPRGGRLRLLSSSWIWPAISIHALREEGDQPRSYDEILNDLFLSTPSARRATFSPNVLQAHRLFLSTPSARRATAPKTSSLVGALSFLSTPSARRATSIAFIKLDMACYFYPRPPRGGRRWNPVPASHGRR